MNKKLISALLALGLCFGMTGCDKIPGMDKAKNWLDSITDGTILEDKFNQDSESSSDISSETPEASYDLEGAKRLLESRLKGTNADSNEDYDLPKDILFGGETYTLAWSVNVEENVEIVVEADGSVWVDVNEALVEEFPFILTAKITAPDGTSVETNFNRVIKAIERFVPAVLDEAPQENVAYKMNAYSVGKGQDLYFAGETTDYWYYLKTTADYNAATDVYAEYVEGSTEEFYLFHKLEAADGSIVKEYINIIKSGTHINAQLSNEPVALKFSTEYGTFYRNIDGEDCVLTTDGSYGTIGGKLASDLGGEVSPACLVTQIDRAEVSAENKLAYEVKTMEIAPMFVGGGDDVALAMHGSRYPDVKISWASNSDALTINRRTMSFADVAETTEVTLTATITIDGKTETKDVTVKVVANNATAILAAAETLGHNKAFGNDVTLTGTMLRFVATNKDDGTYSEQYESITFMMSVEGKEVEGYRMKGLTTEAKDAKPGDILTCKGELLKYSSTLEFSFGTIISRVEGEAPETPDTPDAPEGSAIISFADEANRTSYDVNAQVWEQNGVKVTNNKGASTSDVKDYTNPVRFYKNSQVIVEFAGMQKIEFTCNAAQDYASALKASIPAAEGVIVTVTDNVVKVVFTAPVDSFTIEALSGGQVRVDSIAVYTSVSEGELGGGEVTPPEGGEEGGATTVTLVEGQAYTMYLNQVSLGKELYLTGEMSSKWYATSESKADAADVYAEVVDGGYKLYVLAEDGAKSYFTLQEYQKDNGFWGANVSFSAEGTVFNYNEAGCWAATLTNDTFFLGTYSNYDTISASASSFMKAENMGVNQFPALLVEATPSEGGEEGGEVTPPEGGEEGGEVSGVTLVEGQAYTMYLNQVTLGKELYLTGEVSGTWLATSENKADAADVYAEAANGGYKLYVLAADGAKSYISLEEYQKSNGYWGAHISFAAEGTVFSYNEAGCWAAKLTNDTFFLGTYKDYNTISASGSSFMKAENMGVNQFPALLVEAEVGGETPDTPENPDTHEHNFVDGKCECGEVDPNYTPEGGETPAPETHEHNYVDGVCDVCGEADPNYKPDGGEVDTPVVGGGSADFNTIVTSNANGDAKYTNTYTTTNGWTTVNSAIQAGGPEGCSNPQFSVIGPDNTTKAVCMNGKVGAAGSLTSPTLAGGIAKLTINYTKMFTDTALGFTITITEVATGAVQTKSVSVEIPKDEKYQIYTLEWVLDTAIAGEFTIAIVNDCPSNNSSSNKDRVTLLSVVWEASVQGGEVTPPEGGEPPEEPEHQHNYSAVVTAPTCTEAGYTTYTCACGDTYTDNTVTALGHSFAEGTCGVCGEVDPEFVPDHQHNYSEQVTAPTCTTEGYTTYTCACGDTYTDNTVAALGHSYTDNVCGVCGAEQYKTLTIAEAIALGKTYEKDKYSSEMYYVTGKIIEVQQDYYGNVVISDGEATILVYGIKSEDGSVQYGNFTTTKPVVGDTIKVLSIVGKYNDAQLKDARLISITFATDAEKIAIEKAALTLEDDVLGAKDINLAVAGSIRNDVIITWAVSEGADIAVIENGVLKISNPAAETTVKVVATLACNDESATAEFSIVVSPLAEGAAQPYEATLSFADKANRTTFTTSQQVWVQNGITLTNDKGSSTSSVADYASPARFYKSSKITIACTGMTEIVFTANTSSYASALKSSIPADPNNYTVTLSGSKVTVTFVNAVDTFVIASLTGGQVRMDSMLVKGVK